MDPREMSSEEVKSRGEAIYEKDIRPKYEETHKGQLCVIDIFSRDYEINKDGTQAVIKLRQRRPEAHSWTVRIGFPAAYSSGGAGRRIELN